jgi:hypothetical protein
VRESVDPENTEEHHFDDHPWRIVFEWSHVVGTPCSFLGSAYASFDIGDVFVFPTDIELRFEIVGNGAAGAFKFGVAKDEGDPEATLAVETVDALECLDEAGLLAVVKDLGGNESEIA